MIEKKLGEITVADIERLKDDGVPEGLTLEYKRDLPGTSDGQKREFLADVSAFANAEGGDIIYGLEDVEGSITEILRLEIADTDLEVRRLESMIQDGISPRIRAIARVVADSSRRVLIIRIEKSWVRPHRVIFQNHDKFYARVGASRPQLDVTQLRAAFLQSATISDRISGLRTDRVIDIMNDRAPLPLEKSATVVLHVIPVGALAESAEMDLRAMFQALKSESLWQSKITTPVVTFQGVLLKGEPDQNGRFNSYTHFYRSGILEAVSTDLLEGYSGPKSEDRYIPHTSFEQQVDTYLPRCLRALSNLGVRAPALLGMSLLNVRGLRMARPTSSYDRGNSIREETLIVPGALIEDLGMPILPVLKPLFDRVWNACGFLASENFDEAGNWRKVHGY